MKFTLAQKREVVTRFKGGEDVLTLAMELASASGHVYTWNHSRGIEQVIRDAMNGKFKVPQLKVKK